MHRLNWMMVVALCVLWLAMLPAVPNVSWWHLDGFETGADVDANYAVVALAIEAAPLHRMTWCVMSPTDISLPLLSDERFRPPPPRV